MGYRYLKEETSLLYVPGSNNLFFLLKIEL